MLRIDKETAICPFCLLDKSYAPASHDPRLKDYLVIGEEEEKEEERVEIRIEQWWKLHQPLSRLLQWLQTQWRLLRSPEGSGEMVFVR